MDGWEVLERARELASQGLAFALATVVWRQGPSSGQLGGRAIITAEGQVHGWIGGACAEPVVIREAQRVIADGEARLLLLGTRDQFGEAVPEGMTVVPIACQSDGALEVFVEPVHPSPRLVVVGRSPMAQTLAALAGELGWRATVVDGPDFTGAEVDSGTLVVVATQGHGDEEAIKRAAAAGPAYLGLVASGRRGAAVLGYLTDRGVPPEQLAQVRAPAGLDLGRTSHREIAVAILAELVQLRAAGALATGGPVPASAPATATDPVCGMTVTAGPGSYPREHDGAVYHFCSAGCSQQFAANPAAYLKREPHADHK